MTESQWTAEIVAYLKSQGCVTFKHADGFTRGIPDVSATTHGYTTWMEMKLLKAGQLIRGRVTENPQQHLMMIALSRAGRAIYVIKFASGPVYVFAPTVFMGGDVGQLAYTKLGKPVTLEELLAIVRNT